MAGHKYAYQGFKKEHMARAVGRDLGISTKQSIEICNFLRHRKVDAAKSILERVLDKKQAIPFKRFTNAVGHRRGKMAAGRYPITAANKILGLIESAEANAQSKGLNTNDLEIVHICAQKAAKQMHYGRHHGLKFKRSHIEVVLAETPKKEKKQEKTEKSEKTEKKQEKTENKIAAGNKEA